MKTAIDQSKVIDPKQLVGMDAYSKDNQYIGSVYLVVPEEPEDEVAAEQERVDPLGKSGHVEVPEHVAINGIGTVLQANLTVSIPELSIDWKGRRVTVPMTLAQIEAMPRDRREGAIY